MSAPLKWSGNNNYTTPQFLFDALDYEFGFDFDPCPLNLNPTLPLDGLRSDWSGKRVFVNPPWSDIMPWVNRAFDSHAEIVVMVLPARTDTPWYHRVKDRGAEVRLFRKRVHFVKGTEKRAPTDGTMVAVIRPQTQQLQQQAEVDTKRLNG
jgi:site-specific DNA-methyltransferase (adenine-specific)